MKPKRIFIVRHGESEGNVDKNIYSKKPDYALNLTNVGIHQSKLAGTYLKNEVGNQKLAVYYSPFFRTVQTLNNISVNLNTNKQIVYAREEPRIREQEWHGKIPIDYTEDHSDLISKERDEFGTFYYRMHGGESCADVYDRVSDFMATLNRDFEKTDFPENTLLVMHGMTMRVFMMRWFHKTVEEFETWENPKNCEIWTLTLNDKLKYEFDFNKIEKQIPIHNYRCKLIL